MAINTDQLVPLLASGAILVGGACVLLSQTKFVKDRPGLARLIQGVGYAAGRLSIMIPPGSNTAQVEAAVAQEAASVAAKYSDSVKASGATQEAIAGMIAGELGKLLPPGHVVPAPAVAHPALATLNLSGSGASLTPAVVA